MSGYKTDGDDLLIFQTPAEALAKHKSFVQSPQSTGGRNNAAVGNNGNSGFYQPQYPFQNPRASLTSSNGSASPSGSESSFGKLSPQSTASGSGSTGKVLSQKDRLKQFFDCCDLNKDGRLSEDELCHALRNYDQSEFKRSTARTMIKLFDKNHVNSVDFDDFCSIWNYLSRWRTVFEKCDTDGSLSINHPEFSNALKTFGFDLPLDSINHVFYTFSTAQFNQQPIMKFDAFIESMVWIMKITEVFKKYPSSDGGATAEVGYFDFIDVLLAFKD